MKEINEKYSKKIYLNILKAIIFMTYFLTLNLAYENVRTEYMEIGIKVFTMIFLFIGIYIIEKSYKKDDGDLAIQGIEVLILAIYTLTTEHITNKYNFNFKSYSLVASYLYASYFILRSIFIYTKSRRELVEEFSDIREIVKKEEPIKKEAVKKSEKIVDKKEKNNKEENNKIENSKEENKKSKKENKEQKERASKEEKDNKNKKINKTKKTTNQEKKTENKISTTKNSEIKKDKTQNNKTDKNTENKSNKTVKKEHNDEEEKRRGKRK